ncbi:YcxB family protein [Streptomyces sp. NPDC059010]|uniref:YcxB family protein n=1 Tax=Streptomyces sp. NPDC059010 TaxID=3346695 RepID=UPI0036A84859
MVMDMGRDAVQDGVVELEYKPTVQDLAQALRVRLRASRAGRMRRWLPGALAVLAALQLALMTARDDGSVTSVLWMLIAAGLMAATPWLQARQLHRLAERQGTFRAVVADTGVSVVTDNANMTIGWAALPRYAETSQVFVLLSGDNKAVGITVLPKRGIQDPADADRLRELLDRNLTRV